MTFRHRHPSQCKLIETNEFSEETLPVESGIKRSQRLRSSGLASVIFGLLLAMLPGVGLLALTWLIGIYAIVFGILLLVLAFQCRKLLTVCGWQEDRSPLTVVVSLQSEALTRLFVSLTAFDGLLLSEGRRSVWLAWLHRVWGNDDDP